LAHVELEAHLFEGAGVVVGEASDGVEDVVELVGDSVVAAVSTV
jgi:hypothetical protein